MCRNYTHMHVTRTLVHATAKLPPVLATGLSSNRLIPAGAQAAGCDSLFVAGGIHAEETGEQQSHNDLDLEKLEHLFKEFGVQPTFVIPYLQC